MSLLNDVLRDLEQRQRPASDESKIRRSQLSETPGGNGGSWGRDAFNGASLRGPWLSVILMSILVGGSLSYLVRGEKVVRLELDLPLPELPDRPLSNVIYRPPIPEPRAPETEHVEIQAEPESVAVAEMVSEASGKDGLDESVVPIPQEVPAQFVKTKESFSARLAQARIDLQHGKDVEATLILETLYQEKPMVPAVQELLASARVKQNDFKGALAILNQNDYPDWQRRLLRAKAQLGLPDEKAARLTLGRALPEVAESPDYHAMLAGLYQREKNYRAAGQRYQALIAFNASQGDWWVGLAIAFDQQHRVEPAIEAYRQAVQAPFIAPALKQYARSRLASLQPR